MHLTLIAGARPNFMKIAPIIHAIDKYNQKKKSDIIKFRLVHSGQHYDSRMSKTFFEQLNIPEPDVNLNCGGGTHAEQTAAIMTAFEKDLSTNPTDLVIVVGDVNSTMACSIVAKKNKTKVAHIEAGIRSFDNEMPEEINRIITDSITDFFFTTSITANENLYKVGVDKKNVFFVGNVMIDTLNDNLHRITPPKFFSKLNLEGGKYLVLTLHRPSNVDSKNHLKKIIQEIITNVRQLPVIFPIHPRTAKVFENLNIEFSNLHVVHPMGYLEFIFLVKNAKAVITDSGGITEETTVLRIPCLTLRKNTERPETVTKGTNELIGTNPTAIGPALEKLFQGQWKSGKIPEKWDGLTSKRIVRILLKLFGQ